MKILVIGNGKSDLVGSEEYEMIVASNSSYSRIEETSTPVILVLSESLLWPRSKLEILPPLNSLRKEDQKKSLDIRLEKKNSFSGAKLQEVIVLQINDEIDVKRELEDLDITYSKLKLMSHKGRLFLIFKTLGFFCFISSFCVKTEQPFRFIFSVIKVLFGGMMPLEFRPSTGIISILVALNKKDISSIEYSGIGDNMSSGSYYNNSFVENVSLHSSDHIFLEIIEENFFTLLIK